MASICLPFLWSGKMLMKGIAFAIQKFHVRKRMCNRFIVRAIFSGKITS